MFRIAFITFLVSAALLLASCGKNDQPAPPPAQTPTNQPQPQPQPSQPGNNGGSIGSLQPGQCACDQSGCVYLEKSGCYWWELRSCEQVKYIQECSTRCR